MKKIIGTFLTLGILFVSCSKDAAAGDLNPKDSIIGLWELTNYMVDAEAVGTYQNLGEDILNKLTAEDCVLVAFEFKDDETMTSESGVNFLQVNSGPNGLDVSCPSQKNIVTYSYSYANGMLTLKNGTIVAVSVAASIDGNTMTVDAEGLDFPNFNTPGELVFTKK